MEQISYHVERKEYPPLRPSESLGHRLEARAVFVRGWEVRPGVKGRPRWPRQGQK